MALLQWCSGSVHFSYLTTDMGSLHQHLTVTKARPGMTSPMERLMKNSTEMHGRGHMIQSYEGSALPNLPISADCCGPRRGAVTKTSQLLFVAADI